MGSVHNETLHTTTSEETHTNSQVRSQRATTVFRPGFTLVFTRASKRATCFSTSSGWASASASSLDTFATTEGGGRAEGRRKREAMDSDREWTNRCDTGEVCCSACALSDQCGELKVDRERSGARECWAARNEGTGARHAPSRRSCVSWR